MVYSTAVTRRYTAIRGRALAFSSLGQNMAEAFFPILVVFLLGYFDWRMIWIGLALVAFFSFWPMINILTRKPSSEQEILEFSEKPRTSFLKLSHTVGLTL